ncbi:hypothetical protein QWJ34_11440 [Saccharibacillus sp. CPCC 101409]|uniref:hypothetical protein n=1 Tax=Saccharibacillus sp. CPCC 101409 TaxID=3058041 RepID=UPI0026734854|nr:hypothetical protein [Saccharibacillus sp. CPCC 101409]MDO3410377.1 hypothetical protein [Saccharibacillus sp. CPCC 101409]
MKKRFAFPLVLALGAAFSLPSAPGTPHRAEAASAKEWLTLSSGASYYGEVANGVPDGRGTIKWGSGKQYSGDFVNGKRSGSGKYINRYADSDAYGRSHKVVYSGEWSADKMNGKGEWTQHVTEKDGAQVSNELRTGTFTNNVLTTGYDVIHAQADPDYSFAYLDKGFRLNILSGSQNLLANWKSGALFDVQYRKGAVTKRYSSFAGDTPAQERDRKAAFKYLQTVTSEVAPHLRQFEALSKKVPLS